MLHSTPTWLRTTVHQLVPVGDSTLVIGWVTRIHRDQTPGTPGPLIYHDGSYAKIDTTARKCECGKP